MQFKDFLVDPEESWSSFRYHIGGDTSTPEYAVFSVHQDLLVGYGGRYQSVDTFHPTDTDSLFFNLGVELFTEGNFMLPLRYGDLYFSDFFSACIGGTLPVWTSFHILDSYAVVMYLPNQSFFSFNGSTQKVHRYLSPHPRGVNYTIQHYAEYSGDPIGTVYTRQY